MTRVIAVEKLLFLYYNEPTDKKRSVFMLPEVFLQRMKAQLGEEYEEFLKEYESEVKENGKVKKVG